MKRHLTIEGRRSLVGFTFITPWIIGFFALYLYPLIMSLVYTFNDLNPVNAELSWVGLDNYVYLFREDPDYVPTLLENLKSALYSVPSILVFSMVVALLVNQKMPYSKLFRGVFFLPIIITSGVVLSIIQGDSMSGLLMSGERSSGMFEMVVLRNDLIAMGLGEGIVDFVMNLANDVFNLSWRSGVQIMLFLTGMSSISPSVYEAANIDGCTAWERFWKITFPLVMPMTLVNIIFTLTEQFVSQNAVLDMVINQANNMKFSLSSTIAWVYFVIITTIIAVVYLLVNKRITYIDM
jgi:ABC-type sugar transport system permease subunit